MKKKNHKFLITKDEDKETKNEIKFSKCKHIETFYQNTNTKCVFSRPGISLYKIAARWLIASIAND